ncbi:amidohydrolase family protein [Burkholderia alba]|uniref:amidohydrolase family protein n=1 Tax=Burkholderia alba TaxID=2683677 RepID=UPI002B05E2F9|nr:hypothetical protein [Burkholderia alba]
MSATDHAHPDAGAAVASVISNVRYYDSADRMLKRADIEIRDGEIVGIARPGTLSAFEPVDGSAFVCLPGLVNASLSAGAVRRDDSAASTAANAGERRVAQLGDLLLEAVSNGVTTVGMFGFRVEESLAAITRVGVRASLHREYADLWLGPEPGPVGWDTAECLRDYERTARRFDGARLAIQPAVGSQLAASTHLLTGLHALARRIRRRFVVRVDGGAPWSDAFKDAYGCTGLGLLRSLDVLDENTLVVPAAPMSFADREHLRHSPSHVVYPAGEPAEQPGQRGDIARAGIARRTQAALGWGRGAPPGLIGAEGRARNELAGDVIDLLTWKGAQALTFSGTGTLAVGKRADLLLYDGDLIADSGASAAVCTAILDTVCRHRPRGVLIDGRWVVAGPFHDRAKSPPASRAALAPQPLRDAGHASPRQPS